MTPKAVPPPGALPLDPSTAAIANMVTMAQQQQAAPVKAFQQQAALLVQQQQAASAEAFQQQLLLQQQTPMNNQQANIQNMFQRTAGQHDEKQCGSV